MICISLLLPFTFITSKTRAAVPLLPLIITSLLSLTFKFLVKVLLTISIALSFISAEIPGPVNVLSVILATLLLSKFISHAFPAILLLLIVILLLFSAFTPLQLSVAVIEQLLATTLLLLPLAYIPAPLELLTTICVSLSSICPSSTYTPMQL